MNTSKWVKIVIVVLVIAMLPAAIALAQGGRGLDKVNKIHLVRGQPSQVPASGAPKVVQESVLPNQNPLGLPDSAKGISPMMPVTWKEGFEYLWPNGTWVTFDNNGSGNGDYCWDDEFYRDKKGNWAGYAGNGCGNLFYAPGPYASDMDAWMVLGPFSTSGAKKGTVTSYYWLDSEPGYDYLLWCASVDAVNFHCNGASGYTGNKWIKATLNLKSVPGFGNMLGYPQVWVGWIFYSDANVEYEGAYVDEINVSIK